MIVIVSRSDAAGKQKRAGEQERGLVSESTGRRVGLLPGDPFLEETGQSLGGVAHVFLEVLTHEVLRSVGISIKNELRNFLVDQPHAFACAGGVRSSTRLPDMPATIEWNSNTSVR